LAYFSDEQTLQVPVEISAKVFGGQLEEMTQALLRSRN
jgi:hypothetical protein